MDFLPVTRDWAESRETVELLVLAVFVGLLCGFATAGFTGLIEEVSLVFLPFAWLQDLPPLTRALIIVLAPTVGGLIVGPLLQIFASEARERGVPAVMEAMAERGGVMHPRVAIVETIAAVITLGSGGSAGREGPIVQVGATLGSATGQLFGLGTARLRTLVAGGAAGGIAAIFNAPLAGVFYGTEVLLGEFEARSMSAIVLTAVTASVVIRAIKGNNPAFSVPSYTLISPWELGLDVILGVLAGMVGVAFIVALYAVEDSAHLIRLPVWAKPGLGGLAVGLLGLAYPLSLLPYPAIFGPTYVPIGTAVAGQLGLGVLVALLGGKLLATAFTLGSGGSGGVFGPSLFLGAMLGGAFGTVAHALLPGVTAPAGAYALVGMAAVLGAAGHAPITGIMLAFELVNNYQMILPLMVTTVIAFLVARFLIRESIDTLALVRAGIAYQTHQPAPHGPGVLRATPVSAVMSRNVATVPPSMSVDDLARRFQQTGHHGFPVVDGEGRLRGIVTLSDLERAILAQAAAPSLPGTAHTVSHRVSEIMSTDLAVAYPDETLEEALRTMATLNVGRLPVVESGNPSRMIGLLRRGDLIEAFRQQEPSPPRARQ